MDFLKEWLTNIIIFILLATIFDMLLPRSSLQKYTKLIISLLLITIIITPLLSITKFDIDNVIESMTAFDNLDNRIEAQNLFNKKKREIEKVSDAYILEQMSVQLKEQFNEELIEQFGLSVIQIQFNLKKPTTEHLLENIETIVVIIGTSQLEKELVREIDLVKIDPSKPIQSEQQIDLQKEITTFLNNKFPLFAEIEVFIKEAN